MFLEVKKHISYWQVSLDGCPFLRPPFFRTWSSRCQNLAFYRLQCWSITSFFNAKFGPPKDLCKIYLLYKKSERDPSLSAFIKRSIPSLDPQHFIPGCVNGYVIHTEFSCNYWKPCLLFVYEQYFALELLGLFADEWGPTSRKLIRISMARLGQGRACQYVSGIQFECDDFGNYQG